MRLNHSLWKSGGCFSNSQSDTCIHGIPPQLNSRARGLLIQGWHYIDMYMYNGIPNNYGLWYANNELVTGANLNQRSHHWGASHCMMSIHIPINFSITIFGPLPRYRPAERSLPPRRKFLQTLPANGRAASVPFQGSEIHLAVWRNGDFHGEFHGDLMDFNGILMDFNGF